MKKTYHKDHPDKEYFERFGSFENHITLDYLSGKKLSQGSLPLHYSNKSQTAFACSSMKALISLHKKFNPSKIFDFSGEGVSEDEKSKVEEFYEKVADARKRIMLETAETRNRSILLRSFEQRFDGDEDVYESITQSKLEDERSSFYGMNYTNSNLIHTYCTPILEESRYHKYSKLKSGQDLKLSGFVKLLGLEPKNEDQNIVLGRLLEGIHELGNYRGLADGSSSIDERKFIRNVKRVDEITASAFKKIFTTSDKKEALKYAFIFAALRGYNVRGAMGACWAQEMSLRLVFAQKGWIQFNKMPGTYLDIETCLLGEGNQDEEVEKVINKQVEDYLESIEPTFVPKSTSLFNVPVPLRTNDFDRYLIETQSYQDKDIFRISAYKSDGETALQIAASKGDKRFFSLLNREITQNQSFKKLFRLQNSTINFTALQEEAAKYGDLAVVDEIVKLEENLSLGVMDWLSSIRNNMMGFLLGGSGVHKHEVFVSGVMKRMSDVDDQNPEFVGEEERKSSLAIRPAEHTKLISEQRVDSRNTTH